MIDESRPSLRRLLESAPGHLINVVRDDVATRKPTVAEILASALGGPTVFESRLRAAVDEADLAATTEWRLGFVLGLWVAVVRRSWHRLKEGIGAGRAA